MSEDTCKTLIRVTKVVGNKVQIIVPAWDPCLSFSILKSSIPETLHPHFPLEGRFGHCYFLAQVCLKPKRWQDLRPHEFELSPSSVLMERTKYLDGPVCPVCHSGNIEYLSNHWACHDCDWKTQVVKYKPKMPEGINPNENISVDYGDDD